MSKAKYSNKELLETVKHWHYKGNQFLLLIKNKQKEINSKELLETVKHWHYKGNQFLLLIKNKQKEINSVFDPMIQKAHEAYKEAISQKKKFENPLREAEGYLNQIAPYLKAEKERIRREAELKAQREREEAERKAREEEERKLRERF